MSKGTIIQVSSYNNIRNIVNSVLGKTDPVTTGYGQFLNSSPAVSQTLISSQQWTNLRNDMARAYLHQTNTAIGSELASVNINPPNLQPINSSTIISSAILTQYTNFANLINTNKDIINANRLTPNIALTSTQRTTNWGGTIDVISHTVTVTFSGYTQNNGSSVVSAADHATYFFNAGGYIQLSASFLPSNDPPPLGTKNRMWKDLLAQFSQIQFRAASTQIVGGFNSQTTTPTDAGNNATSDNTAPGVATNVGFRSLVVGSASYTQIFRTTGPASSKYTENDYIIKVRRPTLTTLEFVITFRDDDAGDKTGLGNAVDENVTGTLTSVVRCARPSGTDGNVDVPAPSATSTVL
jgi:hypothetical protein